MFRKCNSKVYILFMFMVLLAPVMIYPFVSSKLDHVNHENRKLYTWEDVKTMSTWENLFPNLEHYIQDNVFYKNESVAAIGWVDENLFHDLFNNRVMLGKENWLFYKGDNCIRDYRGGYELTEAELKEYAAAASRLQDVLEEKGIKLLLLVVPNKETVYGDKYLPSKVVKISENSRADQIVDYIKKNTSCNIVYPKEALINAAEEYQVWQKYDTHYNNVGAFITAQEVLEALGNDKESLHSFSVEKTGYCSGDLANMLGMNSRFSDDIVYAVRGYKDDVHFETVENIAQQNLNFRKIISDVDNDTTVLFIGDSFLGHLQEYAAKNYRTNLFVHRDNYSLLDRDLFATEKPDIVVLQTAERFIGSYGDWANVYASRFSKE